MSPALSSSERRACIKAALPPQYRNWLLPIEVAERAGVTVSWIQNLERQGRITAKRFDYHGRQLRIFSPAVAAEAVALLRRDQDS